MIFMFIGESETIINDETEFGISLMSIRKNGPRTVPWDTRDVTEAVRFVIRHCYLNEFN